MYLHSTEGASNTDQNDQDNTLLEDSVELTTFPYELEKGRVGMEDAITSHPNTFEVQSVSQFLERYRQIPMTHKTGGAAAGVPIRWSAADARGSCVASIDVLRAICASNVVRNKLQNFARFNSGATLRFQVTGNQFFAGKIVAVWIPPNRYGNFMHPADLYPVTYTMVSGVPNQVSIYPTMNETVELEIPILQTNSYWETADFSINPATISLSNPVPAATNTKSPSLGTVNLYVFAPFQGQDETAEAHISVWGKLTHVDIPPVYNYTPISFANNRDEHHIYDSAVQTAVSLDNPLSYLLPACRNWVRNVFDPAPNYPSSLTFHSLHGIASKANQMNETFSSRHNQAKSLAPGRTREATQKEQGGPLSRAMKTVSDISGTLAMIPGPTSAFATAASAVSGLAGSVLSALNLDKPREVSNPAKVMLTYKNLNTGDGLDQTNHLGLLSDNQAVGPGPNQSPQINPALSEICAIPQVIQNARINADTSAKTVIWQWQVSPINIPCANAQHVTTEIVGNPVLNPGTANRCQITTCPTFTSKIASMFEFWRGTMVLDFEFICSSFSRAQFAIVYDPGYNNTDIENYSSVDVTTSPTDWHTQYVLVHGNTKVRFEIPYQAPTWVCSNLVGDPRTWAESSASLVRPYNGTVSLILINPITSFGTSAVQPMDYLISSSMKDPQFFRPTGRYLSSTQGEMMFTIMESASEESEDLLELHSVPVSDGSTNITSVRTIKDAELLNPSSFFGEFTDSLEMLIRRDGLLADLGRNIADGNNYLERYSIFMCDPRSTDALVVPYDYAPEDTYVALQPWSTNSFLLYLSEIFLEWRGDVSYMIVNPKNDTTAYLMYNDEWQNLGLYEASFGNPAALNNPALYNNQPMPRYTDGYQLPAVWTAENSFSEGAYFRPRNNDGIPPIVSVPYYSTTGFHLTPAYFRNGFNNPILLYYPRANNFPGVAIEYAFTESTLIGHACDNFQLSRLYPPNTTTRYFSRKFDIPLVLQPEPPRE